jgi:hypothetical protein
MSSGGSRAAAAEREAGGGAGRGKFELADVVRLFGGEYRRSNHLTSQQSRALWAIEHCRTARLGGHIRKCDNDECRHEVPVYNSCLNRHCPKCQFVRRAAWLSARLGELLPVPYFHPVFTQPHHLNGVVLCNRRAMYDLLFSSAGRTLVKFAASGRHGIEGRLGITAQLHTWDQLLRFHPHVHCIVPGGALSRDGESWTHSREDYLFCVQALGIVFRGKFLDGLKRLYRRGGLRFYGATASLRDPKKFGRLVDRLYARKWNVYCKPPFAGAEKALEYLSRYTHRVAIGNRRILNVAAEGVTFSWRDRGNGDRQRIETLEGVKFLARFMLHVLPRGYMRIRYFGFMGGPKRGRNLETCRRLLGVTPEPEPAEREPEREPEAKPEAVPRPAAQEDPEEKPEERHPRPPDPRAERRSHAQPRREKPQPRKTAAELYLELTGRPIDLCPRCGRGRMIKVAVLPPTTGPPAECIKRKEAS